MAVAVTKFKGLDAAGACGHRLVERVGSAAGKSRLAVLLPYTVQRLESRC
jgi:hypothetical protein